MSALYDCRAAFADTLVALAEQDRIVAVCNDSVGSSNLKEFKQRFPDRLINVGIAEQNMVGVSAGLASRREDSVHLRRILLPDRPRARTDQGRSRLQPAQRQALRDVERHGVRRARADAPLDRGPRLDASDRQHDGDRAGGPGRDGARPYARRAFDGPVFLRLSRMPVPDVCTPAARFEIGRACCCAMVPTSR